LGRLGAEPLRRGIRGAVCRGDEVIVPAYTWDGTAMAVLFAGGVPVFADIDPDTYCLDVESTRAAITPRTRAVIPVHLAMRFVDMDALLDLAREHNLKVIEDCAHAHGGEYKNRGAGSMGDIGCFSFQESKIMTAGEGGMVMTSNLQIFEHLQSQVNCGRASLTDQYKQRVLGSNYRITELQAALLIGQLEMLPDLADRRARSAATLNKALSVACARFRRRTCSVLRRRNRRLTRPVLRRARRRGHSLRRPLL
jgi:dTDP-4-amino-4,6-dideoxygalactose transaminase